MRAGEVAKRAGVNIETLRYFERRGLLPEPSRTPSGHRRYDEDTVRFIRAIKEAQAVGFTLAELSLTRRGDQVLRGEADRVELIGLDRWVGGTHLTRQNLWRWDRTARRLLAG